MNQELKDALAELTRQADRLEHFEVERFDGLQLVRKGENPSSEDFLRARQYWLIVKTVTGLHTAVSKLPNVTKDDVQRDAIPTYKLIDLIRNCRASLP